MSLLLTGWPVWVTALVTILFIVILVMFLFFGTYTRRITVSGEIITLPHTIDMLAPEQGVISQLMVQDGQKVKPGTPLYQLDISRVSPSGNVADTTLLALANQQVHTEDIIRQVEQNRRTTLDSLQQQIGHILKARETSSAMVKSATDGMQAMKRSMDNYDRYRLRGLINSDQQNNQRYLYYQQQSVWHNLNSQLIQQDQQIISLRTKLVTKNADFESQISQYRLRLDDLERQISEAHASNTRLIKSPSSGRISSLSVTVGQMVSSGDNLVQLVPTDKVVYRLILWLPGGSIPWVRSGDAINIRYTAYPSEKFGLFHGRIISVSSAPVAARELQYYASAPKQDAGQRGEVWFKAVAEVSSGIIRQEQKIELTSGMQAQSILFLENRPLYRWMFSAYDTLKNSVTGPLTDDQ